MKFQIKQAKLEHLSEIMNIMEDARNSVTQEEWFVADEEAYVKEVLTDKGFLVGAWEQETGEMAGYFMVYYPDPIDNMGKYISIQELDKVVYMDSTAVKAKYRGHHLQQQMLRKAEEMLNHLQQQEGNKIQYRMCTVHPENQYSLQNMQKEGYEILAKRKMYGELPRYILCKTCCL